ncbi:MAG: ribosome small subunit-dependent GTPase A [Acetatifactor sp.]|nr:ribosome small subunit-dependent GTPase A [Acetatifactor sp.]MDE7353857.1 ribosome small subunit-dependent GTPase A [Acetatifactor sp.]
MRGKIVKGIGGFYYVHEIGECSEEARIYECRAKGIFRKDHRRPLVGDDVEMDILDQEKALGNIRELLPRRSQLIRPAVANVDQALVIFSVAKPRPSFNLLDRFLVMMAWQEIPCVICFNKADLNREEGASYERLYAGCGCRTLCISAAQQEGIDRLSELLAGKTTTVAGPSGVGKSSIVNCLQSGRVMETGQISEKIERGKHTTRHSELIALGGNTFILDTPGFSSLELPCMEKEQLAGYYLEFAEPEKYCRFGGCSHISEPVCGIRDAVEEGSVSRIRYENYCLLYEELKNRKRVK